MSIEKYIKDKLKGYHVEINFYPTGGSILATGCAECETNDDIFETVRFGLNSNTKTLEDAVDKLSAKLIK